MSQNQHGAPQINNSDLVEVLGELLNELKSTLEDPYAPTQSPVLLVLEVFTRVLDRL